MPELTYSVPGLSCSHCEQAVRRELLGVAGVVSVDVDLETKLITVHGEVLDDARLRTASTTRATKPPAPAAARTHAMMRPCAAG